MSINLTLVTCASFVVISAALKMNEDGIKAKASIVEGSYLNNTFEFSMKCNQE